MHFIIISGRSGSGKSTALKILEDNNFYCIDNLPLNLLSDLIKTFNSKTSPYSNVAISVDSRNLLNCSALSNKILDTINHTIVFLDSSNKVLTQRFSETKRKHPLTSNIKPLHEAIEAEKKLISSIKSIANIKIDTSNLNLYQLKAILEKKLLKQNSKKSLILLKSFGFKHGIPLDADFIFDVRSLPNPYWDLNLRNKTGQDAQVKEFLKTKHDAISMINDISCFLERWIPKLINSNRAYLTIGIGCTGGKHRSIYVTEEVATYLEQKKINMQVVHRELKL